MSRAEESHGRGSCNDCRKALFQDDGYSNWTVEGRSFYCMVGAHPADGFDAWYGEDKRLLFGALCEQFEQGEPVAMDVDHENEEHLTPEERTLYEAWSGD